MAIKWGTDSKVRFLDPAFGVPLEIGASGEMNLMVSDSRIDTLKYDVNIEFFNGNTCELKNIRDALKLKQCLKVQLALT